MVLLYLAFGLANPLLYLTGLSRNTRSRMVKEIETCLVIWSKDQPYTMTLLKSMLKNFTRENGLVQLLTDKGLQYSESTLKKIMSALKRFQGFLSESDSEVSTMFRLRYDDHERILSIFESAIRRINQNFSKVSRAAVRERVEKKLISVEDLRHFCSSSTIEVR